MEYLLSILKKYSVIISILIILAGVAWFVLFLKNYVISTGTQKEGISQLLQEGGAFAASHISSPRKLFERQEIKTDKDDFANVKIIDIFARQRDESSGLTEVQQPDGDEAASEPESAEVSPTDEEGDAEAGENIGESIDEGAGEGVVE